MPINISVLTVFEQLYEPFLETSLICRAQEKDIVNFDIVSFFACVEKKERIDAPTCGPGPGMLIRPEVVERAIKKKEAVYGTAFKIFFSPQGEKITQSVLHDIVKKIQDKKHLMLLPARYEGMDARVEEHYADMILSVGDFVLMGGDIPAMMFLEGLLRLIPGVVSKKASIEQESFSGAFVDFPSYTQPIEWKHYIVPEVILSGNHAAIDAWRKQKAVEKTVQDHFSWVRSQQLTSEQYKLVQKNIPAHYVALLHSEVLIGDKREKGVTSVTSIDLHDIARAACTYGLLNFFIVTPLIDQQKIVRRLLDFWNSDYGIEYNKSRHQAVSKVVVNNSLQESITVIKEKHGISPLVIATSARTSFHEKVISFFDQSKVWRLKRPVLFVLGTGKGLSSECIDTADFLLDPIKGFSDYNHLSVRSAAAILFDRWLGITLKR